MPTFFESVSKKARQIACAIAKESEKADNFWAQPGFNSPILGGFRDPLSEYIAPLVPVVCSAEPPDGDPLVFDGPGFEGGQCETAYNFRVQVTTDNPNVTPIDRVQQFQGPVFGLVVDEIPGGSDVYVEHGLNSAGERGRTTIVSGGFQVESSSFSNQGRVDGGPDNCGNPPGGNGGPEPVEICYNQPDGTEVCETVPVTGGRPIIDVNGDLTVPIGFGFASGTLEANLNINTGDINICLPGSGTPGASPCCPPFDPDGPEPPPGEDDPPEPDDEELFVGVIVNITSVGSRVMATELDGGGGISLFIPRAAVISIAIDIGGRRTWTADVNIRKRNQYVPVPPPGVGYTWVIYNEPGFETTVTPVLVEQPANE